METKAIQNNNDHGFLPFGGQRVKKERLDRLFVNAAGEEDPSRREQNIKHFHLGANRYQAVVYPDPVHFKEEGSDEWQEIDNTLEESTDARGRQILKNRAGGLRAEFPRTTDNASMACVTDGGRTFSWRFEQASEAVPVQTRSGAEIRQARLVALAQNTPKFVGRTASSLASADLSELETAQERRADIATLKSEARYDELLPGVSTRYTLNGVRLKEDIILANRAALSAAAIRLPDDYDYAVSETQELRILDKQTGNECFRMSAPVVYDANGEEAAASVALTQCDGYVRMEYMIDDAFLDGAAYPVTIDPVIISTNAIQNIQDTTLVQNSSSNYYTSTQLNVGTFSNLRCVSLLKFTQLARLMASDTVIAAVLQIAPKSSSSSKYIGAYEVLAPWTSSTVTWTNFNPDSTSNISTDAQECQPGSSSEWISFDLTNLYRHWCMNDTGGTSLNNGVAFRTPDNITGDNASTLYSSDASSSYRPVMYVSYISHAGIEGWWQYEEMSAGRAGTVYADLFNGNMVLEHSDTEMTGSRNPVSVNHYYNSCLSDKNLYNCGYGWKTDAHQKITIRTHNSTDYYVWEDGDGTEHFFEATGTQPYTDGEGMELELEHFDNGTSGTYTDDWIIITDKEDNRMRFDVFQAGTAWLTATQDATNANLATWTYVSGYEAEGRIEKITDPVGRETVFSYSGSLLSSIRIPAATTGTYRYVYYTYDGSNRLTGVRYSELGGTTPHTTYAYESGNNMLIRARNYDGVRVNVGYEGTSLYNTSVVVGGVTDQMRRVLSLETVATNSSDTVTESGAKQLFAYKNMCTEVTAVEDTASDAGKKLYYQFNDSGNVVAVRDELGYAKFTKFESGIENKPSDESPLRRAVVNLLRSPDLYANWTASATGGTATRDTATTCMSAPSAKLVKTSGGEAKFRQQVTLQANASYTLSAYVKTSGLTGGLGAYLRLSKVSNVLDNVSSETLTGSTDAAIGNEMPTDGWERVRVGITPTATEAYYVDLVNAADGGTAWFACPQLELGDIANPVNLVSNGDFRYTYTSGAKTLAYEWAQGTSNLTTAPTGVFASSTDSTFPTALSGNYIQLEGIPNLANVAYIQNFRVIGHAGDVFVFGGWASAKSVPNANEVTKGFGFAARLKKTDGTWSNYAMMPMNNEWVGWQFGSWALPTAYDYTEIEMALVYTRNCGLAKFSNVFMYREQFGESYAYDDDKNVVSTTTLAGQKSDIQYDSAKNISRYTQPGRDAEDTDNQYIFYYGDTDADKKKHLMWRSRTPMHMTDYFSYDSYGNQTSARRIDYRVFTDSVPESTYPYIRTETSPSPNGNYPYEQIDARANIVTQTHNSSTGTLTSVEDPTGQTLNYTFDDSKRVTAVQTTGDGKAYKNGYTYENDRIKTIAHNTTSDTTNDVTYTFDYDDLGRKTNVKVGTQTLSTNVYENTRNGLLSEVDYGNGGKVKYAYDEFDRLTGVRYDAETTDRYAYKYGANGKAAEVTDSNLDRVVHTEYDLADRPCLVETRDGTTEELIYQTRLKYNKLGNLERFAEKVGNDAYRSEYEYDRDNRITEITYDGGPHKVSYDYDALGRVTTRTAECGVPAGMLTSTYGYIAGGYGTNSTSPLVSSISQDGISFSYTYDSRGNITSETRDSLMTTYAYDAIGQLIRVNDPHENATWIFNYDRGGNILSKVKYAYTTGTLGTALETIPYTYGDSNWKDKLTAYNGQTITYDAIGNPTNDGTWTYTWQAGRQLAGMSKTGTVISYDYDHNGLRVGKTVNGIHTKYTLRENLITHMEKESNKLHFFYDTQCRPSFISFNGTKYTYIHNLQGDIVGMVDDTGAVVVQYKYDARGKLLATSGTLAATLGAINPFRYRGYVYDDETGFYCLQKRYYAPDLCRFVNADEPSVLEEDEHELLHNNLYVYCENCPVSNFDPTGEAVINIVMAAIFGLVGFAIGDFVAKGLGYSRGWKYWAIRSAVAVGGGILGWFSARLVTKILTSYVIKNPAIIMRIAEKHGGKLVVTAMRFLGINPTKIFTSSKLMAFITKVFNGNPKLIMPDAWVKSLIKVAERYRWIIRLDAPHQNNWSVWHINIGHRHIAISNAMVKLLQKLGLG